MQQVGDADYQGSGTEFWGGMAILIKKSLQRKVNMKLTLFSSFVNQMLTSVDRNIQVLGYINTTELSEHLPDPSQYMYENAQVKQHAK